MTSVLTETSRHTSDSQGHLGYLPGAWVFGCFHSSEYEVSGRIFLANSVVLAFVPSECMGQRKTANRRESEATAGENGKDVFTRNQLWLHVIKLCL